MKLEQRIKEFGKSIAYKAYGCLPGMIIVAALGAMGAGIYYKVKQEIATYSPEYLECSQKCSAGYKYDLRRLREIMDEHDCSIDWWEQSRTSAYHGYERCREGCEKLKWRKE